MARVDDDTDQQHDSAGHQGARGKPSAWLRVFAESPAGIAFEIPPGGATLGRSGPSAKADLPLDDGLTSRLHACISLESAGWRLTDLGSRNGGFVDGAVVARDRSAPLASGSVVRLGDTIAVFHTELGDLEAGATDFFPGVSAPAHLVRRRVQTLARAPGHVLVLGETGTGKERVARRIGEAGRAFVPVNCAELSRELARSQLFGHARGAFSGAVAHQGLIERAGDGTLFLDEIGELPLDVQSELLRFLEDGSYRPVGESELRVSRARVVAATNVDLDEAARLGGFRRDLLARLRATNRPLELPALRERREDIPGWADDFIREAIPGAPSLPWSAGALECLLLYGWPENLRELRGAMRGAIEAPPEWPLQPADLPRRIQDHRRGLRTPSAAPQPAPDDDRADPDREQIEDALRHTSGRMLTAAERLGINRRRLYRLCEKLGIDPQQFRQGA